VQTALWPALALRCAQSFRERSGGFSYLSLHVGELPPTPLLLLTKANGSSCGRHLASACVPRGFRPEFARVRLVRWSASPNAQRRLACSIQDTVPIVMCERRLFRTLAPNSAERSGDDPFDRPLCGVGTELSFCRRSGSRTHGMRRAARMAPMRKARLTSRVRVTEASMSPGRSPERATKRAFRLAGRVSKAARRVAAKV
jgi:hypothetical protein